MSESYYIYEISSRRIVEVIDVEDKDFCPTDGLEYDWDYYSGTWDPRRMAMDINSYTGTLVFWCPDCGRQYDTDMNIERCMCGYDGIDGWEPVDPKKDRIKNLGPPDFICRR
jgi:hypothetical protein